MHGRTISMYVVIVTRANWLRTCTWLSPVIWLDLVVDQWSLLQLSQPAVSSKNKDFWLVLFRQYCLSLVQLEGSLERPAWLMFSSVVGQYIYNRSRDFRLLAAHTDPVDKGFSRTPWNTHWQQAVTVTSVEREAHGMLEILWIRPKYSGEIKCSQSRSSVKKK